MAKIQVLAIVLSIALLVAIVELVRRRRLSEGHSILWLLTGVLVLVLSLWRGALEFAAALLGIYSPPMVLLVSSVGFFVLILLHFSTVISRQADSIKNLTQRLAILQFQMEQLRKNERTDPEEADGDEASVPA